MSLQRVRLADGRVLAYRVYGQTLEAASRAVALYIHGFPSCSLEASLLAHAASRAGLALLAIDRPGIGGSSLYKG